jgi:hypothetical protein
MQNFKLQGGGRSPPKSIRIGLSSRAQQQLEQLVPHYLPCRREQTYKVVALADPVLSADGAENLVTSVSTLLYPDLPFHSAVGLFDDHFFYTHTCARPVILHPICLVTLVFSFLLSIPRNG